MDGFTEKKWFVYLGDHHEGPFTLDEIQGKLTAGQVSSTQYVWCDGMPDWKLMTEVNEFEKIRSTVPVPPPTLGSGATLDRSEQKKIHLTAIRGGGESTGPAEPAATPTATADPALGIPRQSPQMLLQPATVKKVTAVTPGSTGSRKSRRFSRGFVVVLMGVLLLMGGGLAALNGQVDGLTKQPWLLKMPLIGQLLSPIPVLDDVAPEDFEELRFAASQSGGVSAAVVLGQSDPFAPQFYAASNAPDGTEFELRIEGVAETLLNETSASFSVKQTLNKRFARFEPVRGADGKSIPRGSYKITLLNGDQALASKTLFLGGVKDATYLARLKEFHDKLWEKAVAELTELKQFSATLVEQLQLTKSSFADVNRRHQRGNPAARRNWEEISNKWMGLQSQLMDTFAKWTPESLKTDYFYGDLRGQVQSFGSQVLNLHQLQTHFYTSKEAAAESEPKIVITLQTIEGFAQTLTKTLDDFNAAVATRSTPLPPRGVQ